ncbi:retrovirus-related Pol polyprotein from transposon 17.6 [Trichonephila clavipes]|nr:retrovirus-related Pol polyprotein from transposon 17.6 [Trichonephila clavipes]
MEHWMEPEEEGDLVTEYMFKLINRFKRCQEVTINKMEEMQVKRKTWYDKNAVKREFKDEDLVLVLATSRANKLAVQWIGPGTILNKISETSYLVEIPGRRETSQICWSGFSYPFRDQSSGCSRVPYPSHENPNTCILRSSGLLPKRYKSVLGNRCSVDGRVEGKSKEGRNYVDDRE